MIDTIRFPVKLTLSNGSRIPALGLGTYRITQKHEMIDVIGQAYSQGYRHIDTAAFYDNEEAIGAAMKEHNIPREQLFITSKVWLADNGYDTTLASFERSLKQLQTDYLDLYLIHWPSEKTLDTWMALERLYAEGRVKAIGVSNFTEEDLKTIVESNHMKPMVNQIEVHPGYAQQDLVRYCHKHHITVTASAPLARGTLQDDPVLSGIAAKHERTVSQVMLRWLIQRNIVPIPKSVHAERLEENIDVFDFLLDAEDMQGISSVPGGRLFSDPVIE